MAHRGRPATVDGEHLVIQPISLALVRLACIRLQFAKSTFGSFVRPVL
jgi:hypothetical protein